jgi:hypothetical protein
LKNDLLKAPYSFTNLFTNIGLMRST